MTLLRLICVHLRQSTVRFRLFSRQFVSIRGLFVRGSEDFFEDAAT